MAKMIVSLMIASSCFVAGAVALDEKDLIITSVKIETPLPTGLETVGGARDKSNSFYAELKRDARVAPFIDAAEKRYVTKTKDAAANGNHASVNIDCANHPAPYGTVDKSFCALTVAKTYGWYADLDMALTIEGYVKKSVADDFKKR